MYHSGAWVLNKWAELRTIKQYIEVFFLSINGTQLALRKRSVHQFLCAITLLSHVIMKRFL